MSPISASEALRIARGLAVRRFGRRAFTSIGAATLATAAAAPARPVAPAASPAARAAERIAVARASATAAAPDLAAGPLPGPESVGTPEDARMTLLRACAPAVDPTTLLAVIAVESSGDPLAVNINGGPRVHPRTAEDAVAVAEAAIAAGYSVDLGLMQVNSRNLEQLGTTVARMFDPCANVRAGAALLADAYAAAAHTYGDGQPALRAALSAYNTGDFARGFANGYVARYYRAAADPPPSAPAQPADARLAADEVPLTSAPVPGNPYTASPTVYTRVWQDTAAGRTNSTPLTPAFTAR